MRGLSPREPALLLPNTRQKAYSLRHYDLKVVAAHGG